MKDTLILGIESSCDEKRADCAVQRDFLTDRDP